MLTAEAYVETEHPSRYLVQLCRHFNQTGQHLHHRPRRHVEWSDAHGIVNFGWGQCILQATPDTLTLRAEAAAEENLQRVQDLVAGHLDRFARHDHLEVNWQRPETPTVQPAEATTAPAPEGGEVVRRKRRRTICLTAAGALAIAVHLGLGGAMLAASRWTGLATDVVLAVVLVKVIGVTVIALRRLATRRSRASKATAGSGSPRMGLPRLAGSARSSASRGEDGGGTR